MKEDYIKLIFGLKLRQIRNDKDLSLYGLSKLSGLSKSYLNEIENGKKYPKPDKIVLLAEKLEVPYDQLVSLKLDKKLAPIGRLLESNVFKEIPLELFGIKERHLIELVSNAPDKVSAFISTIIEIAQHYNFSKESFYLASLRSYQEANYNYFKHLEDEATAIANRFQINLSSPIKSEDLKEILIEEYHYKINAEALGHQHGLENLRSVFVPKSKTLLVHHEVDESQRTFIYAKELAYQHLKIEQRVNTFPWLSFDSFDPVLNNFYASYVAGALILSKQILDIKLKAIFEKDTFDKSAFLQLINSFNASPESFYQRLTNILPASFGIKNLFFLRHTHQVGTDDYWLKKELHLAHQHSPRANETDEHYCRRWASIKVFKKITSSNKEHEMDIQISEFPEPEVKYLILSSATKDPFKDGHYRSITIGMFIDKSLERKIKFIKDPSLNSYKVGVTCERCSITDCDVRKSPPKHLIKQEKHNQVANLVRELMHEFE
ncbi:DNA-binding protein [Nonlabens sp. MIC269]|uniref:helix-turn-helix domain-containing protein n=1 Tax=Nonlabens sp. MIC269 TaxID=1476901 RepID=UPI0007213A2F|nr:helix-turn-helix transcriptional regulator [Nonlabens sp. MIC269]ALM20241.1 DNA-binding protein [Nonlabens sp. MIC269]